MSIEIPRALIVFVIQSGLWAMAMLIISAVAAFALRHIIYCLKNRKAFWCAVAYLTTQAQRDKANAYTVAQFNQLGSRLSEENPKLLEQIRESLSEWDYFYSPTDFKVAPCQHCKNPNSQLEHRNKTQFRVLCDSCKASGPIKPTPAEAVEDWSNMVWRIK
jgi:hypothetical protein